MKNSFQIGPDQKSRATSVIEHNLRPQGLLNTVKNSRNVLKWISTEQNLLKEQRNKIC